MRVTSYRKQLWTLALLAVSCVSALGQAPGSQMAGVLPDANSLLPVAGVVGFSFLIGGIVCRSIKTRP